MIREILATGLADFRDRARRSAYLVTLIAAVALGYFAVPEADGRWVIMYIGDYRGVYNSAYVGTVTALASSLWLSLAGFYVVRNNIVRDETSGVGQVLAASPMRVIAYLVGKLLSNVMILASMVAVLPVTALVMQLARGESRSIDLAALLSPFLVLALPLVIVTAAVAVLFETIRPLRRGIGNIVWFFGWMFLVVAGQSPSAPLGGLGVSRVADAMREQMTAQGIEVRSDFSLGLLYLESPLRTFDWTGVGVTAGFAGTRVVLVLAAIALAVLPVLWFHRFDTTRQFRARPEVPQEAAPGFVGSSVAVQTRPVATAPALPTTRVRTGSTFLPLLKGEVRILLQGTSKWWWIGAAALTVAALLLPMRAVIMPLLPILWLWPVLIWSRLGTQRHEYAVEALLGAYPHERRRMLAEYGAGVLLTAALGLAPAIRMIVAGDPSGLAAWLGGVLFIPALALLAGSLSRVGRLFQGVYLMLWYAIVNGFAMGDFMGAVRAEDGRPAGPSAVVFVLLAAVMVVAVAMLGGARRRVGA